MVYGTTSPQQQHGHSLYTPLASFSATCFILACFCDFAYWMTVSYLWETISVWLLAVGLLAGGLAILAGIVDLVRSRNVVGLGQSWLIVLGQAVAFGLSLVNVFVHSRDGYTAVVPQGLALSCLAVLVLLVTTMIGRARLARTRTGGFA